MDQLTPAQLLIFMMLKLNPGMFHVTSDGNHIYALIGEGENETLMDIERVDGPNFTTLNEDLLNAVICEHLNAAME